MRAYVEGWGAHCFKEVSFEHLFKAEVDPGEALGRSVVGPSYVDATKEGGKGILCIFSTWSWGVGRLQYLGFPPPPPESTNSDLK